MNLRSSDFTPGSRQAARPFLLDLTVNRSAACRARVKQSVAQCVGLEATGYHSIGARLSTVVEEMASFSLGEDDDLHDAPGPGLQRLRRWRLPHCYVRWLMREKT